MIEAQSQKRSSPQERTAEEVERDILHRVYMGLLRLPHRGLRARMQHVLASVRDEIAALDDLDAEIIQNSYEGLAAALSQKDDGAHREPEESTRQRLDNLDARRRSEQGVRSEGGTE